MSAEIVSVADGILTVRFAGKLNESEVYRPAFGVFNRCNKVRLLILAENFQGSERAGAWGDLSFQVKHDRQIERMAIVCDEMWESLALLFASKGFRKFPIEYFPSPVIDRARTWLAEQECSGSNKA